VWWSSVQRRKIILILIQFIQHFICPHMYLHVKIIRIKNVVNNVYHILSQKHLHVRRNLRTLKNRIFRFSFLYLMYTQKETDERVLLLHLLRRILRSKTKPSETSWRVVRCWNEKSWNSVIRLHSTRVRIVFNYRRLPRWLMPMFLSSAASKVSYQWRHANQGKCSESKKRSVLIGP
jgi:hypothetical protein